MSDFDAQRFGEAVHTERWRRRLSLREAAEQAGVTFNTLYRIERATHEPGVSKAAAVALWAGLSLDAFVRNGRAA